jgi:transglutaminase-like putative cysteine protease
MVCGGWRVLVVLVWLGMASAATAEDGATLQTPVVFQHWVADYKVAADGTYEATMDFRMRLSTQGAVDQNRSAVVPFSDSLQSAEMLEAYTLKSNGTRIDVAPEQTFTRTSPAAVNAPGFSDYKVLIAVFPNVAVGDSIGWRYRLRQTTPFFPGQFWLRRVFGRDTVFEDVRISVEAPADYPLMTQARDMSGGRLADADGMARWQWSFRNDHAVAPEPSAISVLDRDPGLVVSTFPSYAAVAEDYERRAKAEPTEDVRALAAGLTKGVTDQREQAALLAAWVSKNVRYVGVWLGSGGWVPHAAGEVLKNGYGDCKDHSTLLSALLSSVGIPSTTALINAGDSFALPTVAVPEFNHAITYLPSLDLYVDTTSHYTPFGQLPAVDADKPVLLTATGEIGHTPVPTTLANGAVARTRLRVGEDGNAEGETRITLRGAQATAMRRELAALAPLDEAEFVRRRLSNGRGRLFKDDPEKLGEDFSFGAAYTLDNMMPLPGPGGVSFNVGLQFFNLAGMTNTSLPKRTVDFVCDIATFSDEVVIEFPSSASIVALPTDVDVETQAASLTTHYQRDGNVVTALRTLQWHRPSRRCKPDEYMASRSALSRMNAELRRQAIYQ